MPKCVRSSYFTSRVSFTETAVGRPPRAATKTGKVDADGTHGATLVTLTVPGKTEGRVIYLC